MISQSFLLKIFAERAYSFTASAEREIALDVTEKLCFLSVGCDTELTTAVSDKEKTCELPDGNIITVGAKRCRFVKALFLPLVKGPADSTTHLSSTTRSATLTSAGIRTPMSCRQVARPSFFMKVDSES